MDRWLRRYPTIFWSSCFLCLLGYGCSLGSKREKVIVIQPFADFPASLSQQVFKQVKAIYPTTYLRAAIPLPADCYYPPRQRYRADKLIAFLKEEVDNNDTVVMGLTNKDISTTKNGKADWGVMGLAYRPGRACVASTFRLAQKRVASQFYKVSIHELGHTQGLPHCPEANCFMRDAEGGNPTDEEHHFCVQCRDHLRSRGWQLP